MSHIAVIDYGSSNLRSVSKALEAVASPGQKVCVTNDPNIIRDCERAVFPGQGAIGDCMNQLKQLDLIESIKHCIASKPFLGICLGLQSLMTYSDENNGIDCLNIFSGSVKRFVRSNTRTSLEKIPHMGWNQVNWTNSHYLTRGIPTGSYFYFVHSYFVDTSSPKIIASSTNYIQEFTSAVSRENVFATQFHPEKSAKNGLTFLTNFIKWNGNCDSLAD